ncbi:hypothetical protein SAMN05192562_1135 [Kosakonia arachidis]|uniref:Uncharacterized protein n=1 Tax=Kosakonia arachidis TaxID=551989 RepID=A0A1I7E9P0_9ENTR|nr:hypothetical protein SAMN05192562_1135 [Kosakonia arachidis]
MSTPSESFDVTEFKKRVENCFSLTVLEKLHSLICRALPAAERKEYILLINQQEEKILNLERNNHRTNEFSN